MKRLVCVTIAALAVACGNRGTDSRTAGNAGAAQSEPNAQAGARSNEPGDTGSTRDTGPAGAAEREHQRVTLTGCLRGGESAAGTTGTAGRSAATGAGAADAVSGAAGQFMLTNARPDATAPAGSGGTGAGVGANGAGASGGPLVSGVSSYRLSGTTPELQAHVNQRVRIIGTIDTRDTIADAPRSGSRAARDTTPATSGTAGSGVGVPGSSPASSQAAGGTSPQGATASGRSSTPARTVVIESIQMLAAACGQQPS
jgi:hypothetical protein